MQRPVVLRSWSPRSSLGLVASLGLAATHIGCTPAERPPAQDPEATYSTPQASFPSALDTPHNSIMAYATSLQFDTAAGDEQPLPVWDPSGNVVGTVNVRVEPERGAANLTDDELRAGRIIGRFIAGAEYPGFGIPQGTSYLWVEGAGNSLRQVIIPATGPDSLRIRLMSSDLHSGPEEARLFVTADSTGCCIPCGRPRNCPCASYLRLGDLPLFERRPML